MSNQCKCGGPKWSPEEWKMSKEQHEINNCYNYVFDKKIKLGERNEKVQPGIWKSTKKYNKTDCTEIIEKVKKDFSNIRINKLDSIDDEIICTNYKIALVIDNIGSKIDYHFYRQDDNGNWSHKLGNNKISNIDASGNIITNPEKADRNYDKMNNDEFNYDTFCGYYSVPYNIFKN